VSEPIEASTADPSVGVLLDGVVRLLEQDSGTMCSIFLYDRDADCLRVGAAPRLSRPLLEALDGRAVGPTAGVCGTTIRSGDRVIVEDVREDPACATLLALAPDLRGCFSEPIRNLEGEVVGTVAMYFEQVRGPTEPECARVQAAADLAAIVLRGAHTHARALHLARLYAVSSSINEALLHADDSSQLYDVACHIAVERGLASFAWVGLYRSEEDVFEPVSRSSSGAGYLETVYLSLRDPLIEQGPAAKALRSGRPAISNDIARDPSFHWKAAALAHGYRSVAAFPLSAAGHPYGVFVLYGGTTDFFGDEEVRVLTAVATDLSFTIELAQKEAERIRLLAALDERTAQLSRTERLYAALSEVNRAIVRASSPTELMQRVTNALVEAGGIEMAWVGRPDASTGRIVPVARAGDHDGYTDRVSVYYTDDRPGGRGPGGRSFREERIVVANDFVNGAGTEPWREEAQRSGWGAAAALPLRCGDARWGVLMPYAREVGFFGPSEIALLEQVARDVSFALDVLAREEQRSATEFALRQSEDRLRVLQRLGDAIQTSPDAEHTLEHAVRILGEHLGASRCVYADIDIARDSLEVPHDWVVGCRSLVGRHLLSRMMSAETVAKLQGGLPLVMRDANEVQDPATRARFEQLKIGAIVMCGLVRKGELRAVMAVHAFSARDWSEHEVGLIQEFVARCWDQIERRSAEAKLRERDALLRIAGAAAKLGGWSVDLPTLHATCSDEVCAILELPPGSPLTVDQAVAWCLPQDRDVLRSRGLACATEGTALDIEVQFVTAKGRPVWVRLMGRAERNEEGAIARLHGALQDVSDRRLLEDQLRQAQKMEAVGLLAGGVAHDFNNMLSVILTCASILTEDLDLHDPLRSDVEEIQKAGERAAALTRQLLAFSRHQILSPRVIRLTDVVTGMERMLRRLLGASVGLTLLTPSSAGQVRADPGQIEQVIMNLVVNARDAIPAGGQIVVELANDDVTEADRVTRPEIPVGRYVRLAVSDTGTGMDPATRARIFEPFFTTKGPGKGTGLGLSTVFGIVSQSGGYVRVESALGAGTTFELHLPRVDEAPEPHTKETLAPARLTGTETILVVEDDEQVRGVVCTTLRRAGYRVLEAQNAGEAFLVSEQCDEPIPLLLTDVVMPRMTGPELAARLSGTRPEMRVLYMSGYTEDAVLQRGVREGGIEFLNKPFTPDVLLARIRAVLSPPSDRP